MMAKMFYTMEETKAALGKTEDEIKQLSREGRLREFRDGPRLMFKADAVDQLKSEGGGGGRDHVDLGPSDSGAPRKSPPTTPTIVPVTHARPSRPPAPRSMSRSSKGASGSK